MSMRIMLATSPHVRHAAVLQSNFKPDPSAMYSFAPVGLLSLASALRKSLGADPELFDFNKAIVDGKIRLDDSLYKNAAELICTEEPDVFGFMTECDSYHHVLQVMEQVKRLRPDCLCVLGGPHASAVARQTMMRRPEIDAIVIGEGEDTLVDLISVLEREKRESVPGALLRGSKDEILDGGQRPLIPNLDDLPIPAYDLYPGVAEEEIFVEVGRGCPFQCSFCSTAPFWQRRHRVKSPQRILEEIQLVQRLYNSKRVHFTHDLLTTDKRWVTALSQALIAVGSPVKWTCSARTDTVDPDLLKLMAEAGCNAIYFGIESGSERVLKGIEKDVPIEQSLAVLTQCREAGITPNAGFIVGFPMEDRQSLLDTFSAYERALAIGTRPTHIFSFCPFASSTMYRSLNDMECDGHFLDIPITPAIDEANRTLIASDRDLFGSYFRPRLDVSPTVIKGADEFSNLVEPVAAPAFRLSRAIGGMLEVFDRWAAWIEKRNIAAGVSAHRRFYGSPLDFSEFVVAELGAIVPSNDPMLQLAELTRISLSLAAKWANTPPTTMATHRSVDMPKLGEPVTIGDKLRLNRALATMRLDYDLAPLLNTALDNMIEPESKPTYLMWDLSDEGGIRLSQVDPLLFSALEQLEEGPKPVAEIMIEWASSGQSIDYERLIHVLTEAKKLQLVETL
jgi:radical SAM superfamily enzyme YgiQ (UPF0313 family)